MIRALASRTSEPGSPCPPGGRSAGPSGAGGVGRVVGTGGLAGGAAPGLGRAREGREQGGHGVQGEGVVGVGDDVVDVLPACSASRIAASSFSPEYRPMREAASPRARCA